MNKSDNTKIPGGEQIIYNDNKVIKCSNNSIISIMETDDDGYTSLIQLNFGCNFSNKSSN